MIRDMGREHKFNAIASMVKQVQLMFNKKVIPTHSVYRKLPCLETILGKFLTM